jgi:hypothetical protein
MAVATWILALSAAACGSTASNQGAGQTGATNKCPPGEAAPPSTPSPGNASFVLTNTATTDRYVVTKGYDCDAFAIDMLLLSIPFSCGCECAPVVVTAMDLVALKPGESTTIAWDETKVVPYVGSNTCPADEGCAPIQDGVKQAVPAGTYTASFLVTDKAPTGAIVREDGTLIVSADLNTKETPAGLCPGIGSPLQKTFTIPPSFDTTVDIVLE